MPFCLLQVLLQQLGLIEAIWCHVHLSSNSSPMVQLTSCLCIHRSRASEGRKFQQNYSSIDPKLRGSKYVLCASFWLLTSPHVNCWQNLLFVLPCLVQLRMIFMHLCTAGNISSDTKKKLRHGVQLHDPCCHDFAYVADLLRS